MYQVLLFGQKATRKTFNTYEQARQFARKCVRKAFTPQTLIFGRWVSNPPIGEFGYNIRKV